MPNRRWKCTLSWNLLTGPIRAGEGSDEACGDPEEIPLALFSIEAKSPQAEDIVSIRAKLCGRVKDDMLSFSTHILGNYKDKKRKEVFVESITDFLSSLYLMAEDDAEKEKISIH